MKLLKSFCLLFTGCFLANVVIAQSLESNRLQIKSAGEQLAPLTTQFWQQLPDRDLDTLVHELLNNNFYDSTNEFHNYHLGGLLFDIYPDQAYRLHKKAYQKRPNDQNFLLEYILELQRRKQYKEVIPLIQRYAAQNREDYRMQVYLAESYLNLGKINEALAHWKQVKWRDHKDGVDNAICLIHANYQQLIERNRKRRQIRAGDLSKAGDLLYQDFYWQQDCAEPFTQIELLKGDMKLLREKASSKDYDLFNAYVTAKQQRNSDSLLTILVRNKLVVDSFPLPPYGKLTSDLLRHCFDVGILDYTKFYQARGKEILALAKAN